MTNETLNFTVQVAATVAFAVAEVLAVSSHGIDLFGACVMGIIASIGGGTIRDVILGVPVFWSTDLSYIWVALAASVVTFFGRSLFERKRLGNHGSTPAR